jgi:hypothetical protein
MKNQRKRASTKARAQERKQQSPAQDSIQKRKGATKVRNSKCNMLHVTLALGAT